MSKENRFDKIQASMEKSIVPIATKISGQRHLSAVKDAMTLLIPLTIIGGFPILLASPPVNPETMAPTNIFFSFLLAWKSWATINSVILMIPFNLTLGVLSIYVVTGVAYRLADTYKLNALVNAISALLVFLCVAAAPVTLEKGSFMPTSELGAGAMFSAIIIAIIVVEINNIFITKNIKIKMPDSVPPMVSGPFEVLISLTFNILIFIGLNVVCTNITGSGLTQLIFKILQPLLSATDSLPSILLITIFSLLLWFFGIHGDNATSPIVTPIITMNVALNLEAYQAGNPMPHIFAGQLQGVWATWLIYSSLLVTMIIVAKSAQLRSLIKIAPLSTLFNVNEPLIFGVPTVLNIYTFIPSVICCFIDITVVYITSSIGLIGKTYLLIPWTTPAPLAAFLSTMDWKAPILWLALMAVNIIIFIPFIKKYDLSLLATENIEDSIETK